ncbi:MAG: histidinol-phosphatase [Desulfobacteraceae bacterium]|jgi:histidinol-phosphatase (PHP family)|nr:histidinol-phosphatase [Desulfobacteraceae bacterium]
MTTGTPPALVSVHGGHSGEFCQHASDSLEAILEAYAAQGFAWVGITEHMPPTEDRFRYPDEIAAGLDARALRERFARYIATGRRLQAAFAGRMTVFVGMETETYSGAVAYARELAAAFAPDYLVGSVHHVADHNFDFSPEAYTRAAHAVGGLDALYIRYFDLQLEMIQALKPAVVGHFDLVRVYDPDYRARLERPEIRTRIRRNLACIRDLGLILDFNVRALVKGATEPYIAAPILQAAHAMGIALVPGDDSHGVDTVGRHIPRAIDLLQALGASTDWPCPVSRGHKSPQLA